MAEYESGEAEPEYKQSKYNSAIAQLYRIDNLWKDCHTHARNILYAKWNENLDRIWLELVPEAKPGDKEKYAGFNTALYKLSIYGLNPKLRKQDPSLYNKTMNLQKQTLMGKESFLREIQQNQGKGSVHDDGGEDYMD